MAAHRSKNNGQPRDLRSTFGQVTVRKGYATQRQVTEALEIQRQLREQTGKRKLMGMVMLEMGVLGTTELIEVLKEMNKLPDVQTSVIRLPRKKVAVKSRSKS